jgi:hypothetical protein
MWTLIVLLLGVGAVGAGLRFVPGSPLAALGNGAGAPQPGTTAEPTAEPTPPPEPLPFRSAAITAAGLDTKGFLSWALLDRRSGEVVGSANMPSLTTTLSMIKAWFAADYLRLATEDGREPTKAQLGRLEIMIRDSDNAVAENLYLTSLENGGLGRATTIQRLKARCGVQDAKAATNNRFGYTQLSARDAVRMGACIADGRAAGSKWTPWLLDKMRKVRGVGDFGIREALPTAIQPQVAIKNGWDSWSEDNTYRTNCLAIGDSWVLAVLQRYPRRGDDNLDLAHTQKVCEETARALLNPAAR